MKDWEEIPQFIQTFSNTQTHPRKIGINYVNSIQNKIDYVLHIGQLFIRNSSAKTNHQEDQFLAEFSLTPTRSLLTAECRLSPQQPQQQQHAVNYWRLSHYHHCPLRHAPIRAWPLTHMRDRCLCHFDIQILPMIDQCRYYNAPAAHTSLPTAPRTIPDRFSL